jgi:hypothetical protein
VEGADHPVVAAAAILASISGSDGGGDDDSARERQGLTLVHPLAQPEPPLSVCRFVSVRLG